MLLAQLRAHLYTENEDVKIAELMSLDTADYNALKAEMYAQDTQHINGQSVEQVFIDYRIRQEGVIRDLEKVANDGKTPKAAVVGALRAKSDIIDKVIGRGQEFGLIEKVPEKKQIVAGVLVAAMSMNELRGAITKQAKELGGLLNKYGKGDILDAEFTRESDLPALPAKGTKLATLEVGSAGLDNTEPVHVPTFSDLGKTGKATGGVVKAKGGKATVAGRVKSAPPILPAE